MVTALNTLKTHLQRVFFKVTINTIKTGIVFFHLITSIAFFFRMRNLVLNKGTAIVSIKNR